MEFGLDKYVKYTFQKEKLKNTRSLILVVDAAINEYVQEQSYKHLGIDDGSIMSFQACKRR